MVTLRGQGVFFGKTDGCIGCRGSKAFKNDPSGINSEIRNFKKKIIDLATQLKKYLWSNFV